MAIALIAGGVLSIAVLIPRYVTGGALVGGLSPAFMPYVAAGLATLAACGMLLESLRAGRASGIDNARLLPANLRFLGACTLVLGVSYALMALVGYVPGGAVLVAGLLALARVKLVPLAVAALTTPIALWLVFVALLAMPLP